jgi:hypothetical protein
MFTVRSVCRVKQSTTLFEKISQGRSKVAGAARPGRPVETETEATVQRVEELIRADRRITIDSVAMLVEDMSRNKCFFFQVRISHVLRFISFCDLFTDSPLQYYRMIN